MSRHRRSSPPLFGIDLAGLSDVRRRDVAIRFAFGAAVSMVAGLVAQAFGARVGGLFLAFPAILPATLTLIEQEESQAKAAHDDDGAILGAVGLMAFGAVGWWVTGHHGTAIGLAAAAGAWAVVSVALYLLSRAAFPE
ncbi:MAG TPA: DUF3147 family protein [Acidimicrobiales bacterium]|nr:DUF3147 family protein [Acidimicrobiales bacterium]